MSGGTTILGLSFAWLGIYQQIKTALEIRRSEKQCFLESLALELSNIEHWIGHYPTENFEFWWSLPNVQDWKMPFAKVVYPFGHEVIRTGIREGIQKGLSPRLVHELVILEQAVLVFECILELLKRLAYANPTVSWNLTEKVRTSTNQTVILTPEELALIMQNFALNKFLHVQCIGNDDEVSQEGSEMSHDKDSAETPESKERPAQETDIVVSQGASAATEHVKDEGTMPNASTSKSPPEALSPGESIELASLLAKLQPDFEKRLFETIKTSIAAAAHQSVKETLSVAIREAVQNGMTAGLLSAQSKTLERKRNLYSAYKRTQELLQEEFATFEGSKQFKPSAWMILVNWFVWLLAAIGAFVILSAFVHFPKVSIETHVHVDEAISKPTEKQIRNSNSNGGGKPAVESSETKGSEK